MSFVASLPRQTLVRLRIRHLLLIATVARVGTLHRAAEEMNITQPAVSKMLQDVEDILAVRIFERRPRGLVPTEIGAFVVAYAEQLLVDQERFLRGLSNLKRGGYGALSIGAIMATAPDILPAAIAELKRRRPLMTIRLSTTTSDELLRGLEKNEIDLVIGRLTEARHHAIFDVEPLSNENLWVFAAFDHPLAGRPEVSLAKMEAYPWVLQQQTSPMRQVIDRSFAQAGLPSLNNLVETTSIFATLQLVRRAGMISVLPHTIIAEAVDRGEIIQLPFILDNPLEPYGIIRRRGEPLSGNAEDFAEIVRGFIKARA
ncbi:MAG: LysR family transcriptional regulator [Bosea sp.]|uniref:LysR substrate-binding domain-containing protein n=1 Tax=Bosea sp. (in: a-proteobacteria) TaxID=1871050 RepID=UPI0010F86692|nr:LysR family transcriptional regulator [Bosea sp. (in: a-proteobacteria)]MCP4738782.1 LysR family transcriptional regulator [Bosea sp. (in: a-proteobacteria)]